MSKTKRIFDRIWSTAIIVLNTVYGIFVSLFAFYEFMTDPYNAEKYLMGFMASIIAIATVNIINFVTRKLIKNY